MVDFWKRDNMSGVQQSVYMNHRSFVLAVPNAPTIGTATATAPTTATVSFTAPEFNGGATITSYTATSNPGNITGTLSQAGSGTITVSGLTEGTAYTFTVKATNSIGTSAASSASNSITTPLAPFNVQYLVIAGGGGGGIEFGAAGGGAGGYRTATGLSLNRSTNYSVTVGAGGATRAKGSNSTFHTITSAGGGNGSDAVTDGAGLNGGSGGGGRRDGPNPRPGGSGNTPFVSPSQGNNGGTGWAESENGAGGGGGGAGAVGNNAPRRVGAVGGAGLASTITGPSVTRGGGGGGCAEPRIGGGTCAGGGAGGGGAGGTGAGTANTGGGGGGGNKDNDGGPLGGPGGSGVVILRYVNTRTISNPGGGLTLSTATSGSDRITTITAGTGNVSWS